jgi:hypothetical protein
MLFLIHSDETQSTEMNGQQKSLSVCSLQKNTYSVIGWFGPGKQCVLSLLFDLELPEHSIQKNEEKGNQSVTCQRMSKTHQTSSWEMNVFSGTVVI